MAKRVGAFVSEEMLGMIGIVVSIGQGGAMKSFRRVLREYIGEKLVVLQGDPLPIASAHRRAILSLCCLVVENRLATIYYRHMLSALANGDWRRHDRIEHYCRGWCKDMSETVRRSLTFFVNCTARRPPPIFPRNRWTRADETCQSILFPIRVHGILPKVYTAWVASMGTRVRAQRALALGLMVVDIEYEALNHGVDDAGFGGGCEVGGSGHTAA